MPGRPDATNEGRHCSAVKTFLCWQVFTEWASPCHLHRSDFVVNQHSVTQGGVAMTIPTCKLPNLDRFKVLRSVPTLGIGTIWMGRRWPTNNIDYQKPTADEIHSFLNHAYDNGLRMFDTAAAYGDSERVLGEWFDANPQNAENSFIATKWGENFDLTAETFSIDHSANQLSKSLERSLSYLPKIDLLYIHHANEDVLSDGHAQQTMKAATKFTGASISSISILEKVVEKGLLWTDFLQTKASVARERPDLIERVYNNGTAVVVNAPVRKLPSGTTPKASYSHLVRHPHVSFMLTGTRTHLEETLGYFK